jgi:hypothetical protein
MSDNGQCRWYIDNKLWTYFDSYFGCPQGNAICSYYRIYGVCKFGPTCKFDHPLVAAIPQNYGLPSPTLSVFDPSLLTSPRRLSTVQPSETSPSKQSTDKLQQSDTKAATEDSSKQADDTTSNSRTPSSESLHEWTPRSLILSFGLFFWRNILYIPSIPPLLICNSAGLDSLFNGCCDNHELVGGRRHFFVVNKMQVESLWLSFTLLSLGVNMVNTPTNTEWQSQVCSNSCMNRVSILVQSIKNQVTLKLEESKLAWVYFIVLLWIILLFMAKSIVHKRKTSIVHKWKSINWLNELRKLVN